jgi:hypothetical protein
MRIAEELMGAPLTDVYGLHLSQDHQFQRYTIDSILA